MADDLPNLEQINLCKERKHEKIFGTFFKRLVNVRDSQTFRFQDCVHEAGNDINKAYNCLEGYIQGMEKDNVDLVDFFQSQ